MELYVINPSTGKPTAVIDSFNSLIWTKRYYTYGDFELYIPADRTLLDALQPNFFITRDDDDSVMIIEKLEIQTDAENGDYFIVSGRSLESILSYRVVSVQTNVDNLDPIAAIKSIVTMHTTMAPRVFPGLQIDDSLSIEETMTAQYTGNNLMDVVTEICQRYSFGLKMVLSGTTITLSFYMGQEVDVTFSPEFDNLINSKSLVDFTNYATYAYVAGEGEGLARIYSGAGESTSGFTRREIFVDARDLSSNNGDIEMTEYRKKLTQRGREKLAEHNVIRTFEAEIEPQMTYQYKEDYNLGDIVKIENEYGMTSSPRIVEIIESWSDTGYTVVPTFEK